MKRALFPLFLISLASCASSFPELDLNGSLLVISRPASLYDGEVWQCQIDDDSQSVAQLVAVRYKRGEGGIHGGGEYAFYINPLGKGVLNLDLVKTHFLGEDALEREKKSYLVDYADDGKLIFEEIT